MGFVLLVGRKRKERELPIAEDGVIPSPFDPDYECVPVGTCADSPSPPPGGQEESSAPRLCPEGFVPRRRRREYDLEGKVIRTHRPAERNPEAQESTPPDGPPNP